MCLKSVRGLQTSFFAISGDNGTTPLEVSPGCLKTREYASILFFHRRHLKHLFLRFAYEGNALCVLKARFRAVHLPVAGISPEVHAIYVL